MPQFYIEVTPSHGGTDGPDPQGFDLPGVGAARALVVETLIGFAREQPLSGETRTITVTARDEKGSTVYSDSATVQRRTLPGPDDPAVWRAMVAMNHSA